MAVPYLILGRLLRIECTYVESATRLTGPSLTGRIAELTPGVRLQRQWPGWHRRRWLLVDSVFDRFVAVKRSPRTYRSALVTVGTERFPFPRAVKALEAEMGDRIDISWQTGHTQFVTPLTGDHRAWWPADALSQAAQDSDLVVTHAGVGSVLMALRAGRLPVLIPRRAEMGEHVDDHQLELARLLQDRGLAVVAEPGQPLGPLLEKAASYTVQRRGVTERAA